jgi:hypothetical protein
VERSQDARRCHVTQPFVFKLRSLITVISDESDAEEPRTCKTKH